MEKQLKTIYSDYDNLELDDEEYNIAFDDFMMDVRDYDRESKYTDYLIKGHRYSFYPDFDKGGDFIPVRKENTCLKSVLNKCFGRDTDYLVVEENEKNGEMIVTCVDHDGRNTFHIKKLNKNHRWEHVKFSDTLKLCY